MKNIRMIAIALVLVAGTCGVLLLGVTKTIRVPQPAVAGQAIQHVDENVDMEEEDPIMRISFSALMETKREENLPYIIARVQVGSGHHSYYNAHTLNQYLFGILGNAPLRALNTYQNVYRTPIARLDYFIINEPIEGSALRTQEFRHFCSFNDLVANTAHWAAEFYANQPAPAEPVLTPAEVLDRAYGFYYGHNTEHEAGEPDYGRALADFQYVADQDEDLESAADAARTLGDMYREGQGTERNYDQAVAYYRRAADQLYDDYVALEALENLGDMYRTGEGVARNYEQALDYYNQVIARAGEAMLLQYAADVHIKLGDMYYNGQLGLQRTYEQARHHYERAAQEGVALEDINNVHAATIAKCKLGKMYYDGVGVQRNVNRARTYFTQALADPYIDTENDAIVTEALEYLDRIDAAAATNARLEIGKKYAAALMHDEALRYLQPAANQRADIGVAIKALSALGGIYTINSGGQGVVQDYPQALAYFNQAVDLAEQHGLSAQAASAQVGLGEIYYYGHGVAPDRPQALAHYEQAAGQTDDPIAAANAQYYLISLYYYGGNGITQDYARARRYCEDVVQSQHAEAWQKTSVREYLGKMYYLGHGVTQDYAQARTYFNEVLADEAASNLDKASAKRYLGEMYRLGLGVPQNNEQARTYFNEVLADEAASASDRQAVRTSLDEMGVS